MKREELFLVSKLWNSFHDSDRVGPICKKQLQDWGIDYFDLFIVHFPIALKYVDPKIRYPPGWNDENDKLSTSKTPLSATWKAMEALVDEGLAKSIGISNYNAALVMDALRYARIPPATLQIEHHPYLTQETLLSLCKDNDIRVTAYSSFGPQSFVELDMKSAKDATLLFDNDTVKKIAGKHDKSPAQVLLRWATQRGVAVIPKSNNQDRLAQNLDVCSFDLAEDEVKAISGLNKGLRFNDPIAVSLKVPISVELILMSFAVWCEAADLCLNAAGDGRCGEEDSMLLFIDDESHKNDCYPIKCLVLIYIRYMLQGISSTFARVDVKYTCISMFMITPISHSWTHASMRISCSEPQFGQYSLHLRNTPSRRLVLETQLPHHQPQDKHMTLGR